MQLAKAATGSTATTEPSRPPLTAGSTVRNAEDSTAEAEPVEQLESAIVPPDFERQKVPLEKGFSQMDWMRLQSKGKDLQGQPMNGVLLPCCDPFLRSCPSPKYFPDYLIPIALFQCTLKHASLAPEQWSGYE